MAAFLVLAIAAAALPTPPPDDRRNIDFSTAIVARVGDALWPNWARTPFQIDLLTQDGAVYVNATSPPAPPRFPRDAEATVFLNGVPTVVIGEPRFTESATPVRWSITLLHEHFHQWQYSWPQYPAAVDALNLSHGSAGPMWMLDYAFPYGDARIDRAYAIMSADLADALDYRDAPWFDAAVKRYVAARRAFAAMLESGDYRYFAFQCWQEGAARYTEIAVARAAVQAHARDPSFLSASEAGALAHDADSTYDALTERLRNAPLQRDQRRDFYAIGAGEALLLDRVSPGWHARYLDPRLDLSAFFPAWS